MSGMKAQGAAEHLSGLLGTMFGYESGYFVGVTEEDRIDVDPDTAWLIVEMLYELLPDCWRAERFYGHAVEDGCPFPNAICFSCADRGKKLPTRAMEKFRQKH